MTGPEVPAPIEAFSDPRDAIAWRAGWLAGYDAREHASIRSASTDLLMPRPEGALTADGGWVTCDRIAIPHLERVGCTNPVAAPDSWWPEKTGTQ